VEQAEKTPELAFKVNAEGAKYLAQACKQHSVTLIHISTDYVFDGNKTSPYTVLDVPNPINQYGKSKLQGEEYIRAILRNHYIIRTSWLYSKKYGHNFYRTVLKKASERQELRVTDTQQGCPTNTENLAKFIMEEAVAGKVAFGTHHFTDGKPMTWYDFAQQILEENGLIDRAKLILDRNYRTLAKRPQNSVLI
jgi:dTDP-4-dehydrorhamnose reductase